MPSYRLIADHGRPGDVFEAEDDAEAERRARAAAAHVSTAQATGYRLEVKESSIWRVVAAWMPRYVVDHDGSSQDLVLSLLGGTDRRTARRELAGGGFLAHAVRGSSRKVEQPAPTIKAPAGQAGG